MRNVVILATLAWIAFGAAETAAHNKSVSYSDWSVAADETIVVRMRIPARLTTLLLKGQTGRDAFAAAIDHVTGRLHARQGDTPCARRSDALRLSGPPDMLVIEVRFSCPHGPRGNVTVRNDAFFDFTAGHLHFIRSVYATDNTIKETVLTAGARETLLFHKADNDAATKNDWALFGAGVNHILGGPDHLVFVMGLLLIANPGRDLLFAVTGFTIGHSLSLAAAITDFATADSASVEALIALTIWLLGALAISRHISSNGKTLIVTAAALLAAACIASLLSGGFVNAPFWIGVSILTVAYLSIATREHIAVGPASLLLTASLGLAHGFGFAGGLQEAFGDTNSLAVSLVAFNLGVEAGQLIFIALVLAITFALRHLPSAHRVARPAQTVAAIFVSASGAFWFAERVIFPGGLS